MPNTHALMEKIQALGAEQVGEVEDFVDFLAAKSRRLAALDRLLAVAPAVEAAGGAGLSEPQLAAEIEAVRQQRAGGADRT